MSSLIVTYVCRFVRRFSRDGRGVSAVEFALIAPLMIVMFFGTTEIAQLLSANRKLTQTANTIADLVSQDDAVTNAELNDVFIAAGAIMQPFPAAPLAMRVSSVQMDANNRISVDWSRGVHMSARTQGSSPTMPTGLLQPGTSVIFAEVNYAYDSPVSVVLRQPISMSKTFYLRPRRSVNVTGP